jgi:hypothetical protein
VPRARSSLPVEFLPTRRAGRGAAARVQVTAAMREFNRFVLVPARLNAAVSWAPASKYSTVVLVVAVPPFAPRQIRLAVTNSRAG